MKTEKHFKRNTELEKRIDRILDSDGHINGQGRFPVGIMNFGHVHAGFASCELIAVYNVLNDLGLHISLSQIIYDAERLGYLFAGGIFGTKISKIGKILNHYGVKSEKVKVSEFKLHSKLNHFQDGDTFIVTIKNRNDLPVCSLHTFEMVYYEGKWTVYNRFNGDNHASVYSNSDDVLNNGGEKGAYYSIYKIIV